MNISIGTCEDSSLVAKQKVAVSSRTAKESNMSTLQKMSRKEIVEKIESCLLRRPSIADIKNADIMKPNKISNDFGTSSHLFETFLIDSMKSKECRSILLPLSKVAMQHGILLGQNGHYLLSVKWISQVEKLLQDHGCVKVPKEIPEIQQAHMIFKLAADAQNNQDFTKASNFYNRLVKMLYIFTKEDRLAILMGAASCNFRCNEVKAKGAAALYARIIDDVYREGEIVLSADQRKTVELIINGKEIVSDGVERISELSERQSLLHNAMRKLRKARGLPPTTMDGYENRQTVTTELETIERLKNRIASLEAKLQKKDDQLENMKWQNDMSKKKIKLCSRHAKKIHDRYKKLKESVRNKDLTTQPKSGHSN